MKTLFAIFAGIIALAGVAVAQDSRATKNDREIGDLTEYLTKNRTIYAITRLGVYRLEFNEAVRGPVYTDGHCEVIIDNIPVEGKERFRGYEPGVCQAAARSAGMERVNGEYVSVFQITHSVFAADPRQNCGRFWNQNWEVYSKYSSDVWMLYEEPGSCRVPTISTDGTCRFGRCGINSSGAHVGFLTPNREKALSLFKEPPARYAAFKTLSTGRGR